MSRRVTIGVALALPLLACSRASVPPAPAAPAVAADAGESASAYLFRNFRDTYAPLKSCLVGKVGAVDSNRAAAAIVAAGLAPRLERATRELAWEGLPGRAEALDAAADPATRARRQLVLLAHFAPDRKDTDVEFASYRLLREVAAAVVVADSLKGACAKPPTLEYWGRESERLDLLQNVGIEYDALEHCVDAAIGPPSRELPEQIAAKGLLPDLEALAARAVAPAPLPKRDANATDALWARSLVQEVARVAATVRPASQGMEPRLRGAVVLSGLQVLRSRASGLDCRLPEKGWHGTAEWYLREHPASATPRPVATATPARAPAPSNA